MKTLWNIEVWFTDENGRSVSIKRTLNLKYSKKKYVRDEGVIRDTLVDIGNQFIDEEFYGQT